MTQPTFHVAVVLRHRQCITELRVHHVTGKRKSRRPRHIVRIIVPVCRSYVGDATVLTLCVADIHRPLGIERSVIEDIAFAPASHRVIAQPRLTLVALRTVHRHSFIVAADTPAGIPVNPVQCFIGAGERTDSLQIVIHHLTDKIREYRFIHARHLYITETVIHETRSPFHSFLIPPAYVGIRHTGIAQVPDI